MTSLVYDCHFNDSFLSLTLVGLGYLCANEFKHAFGEVSMCDGHSVRTEAFIVEESNNYVIHFCS